MSSLFCFLKIYSYRNVLEIICCYKSYLYWYIKNAYKNVDTKVVPTHLL